MLTLKKCLLAATAVFAFAEEQHVAEPPVES